MLDNGPVVSLVHYVEKQGTTDEVKRCKGVWATQEIAIEALVEHIKRLVTVDIISDGFAVVSVPEIRYEVQQRRVSATKDFLF